MSENNSNRNGLDTLFVLFDDKLTLSDITSAKYLGKISAAIVKKRVDLKMTQKEFAKYLSVSQGMVSKWESGDYNFTVKNLAELSEKLNLELYINLKEYNENVITSAEDHFSFFHSEETTFIGKRSNIIDFPYVKNFYEPSKQEEL